MTSPLLEPKPFGNCKPGHDWLQGMFMYIGAPSWVGTNLILQSIDVPELRRGRVHIEEIVNTQ